MMFDFNQELAEETLNEKIQQFDRTIPPHERYLPQEADRVRPEDALTSPEETEEEVPTEEVPTEEVPTEENPAEEDISAMLKVLGFDSEEALDKRIADEVQAALGEFQQTTPQRTPETLAGGQMPSMGEAYGRAASMATAPFDIVDQGFWSGAKAIKEGKPVISSAIEGMKKPIENIIRPAGTEAEEGVQPSEVVGGGLISDILAQPSNLIGLGLFSKASKAGKAVKGAEKVIEKAKPVVGKTKEHVAKMLGYSPEDIAKVGKKTLPGRQKKIPAIPFKEDLTIAKGHVPPGGPPYKPSAEEFVEESKKAIRREGGGRISGRPLMEPTSPITRGPAETRLGGAPARGPGYKYTPPVPAKEVEESRRYLAKAMGEGNAAAAIKNYAEKTGKSVDEAANEIAAKLKKAEGQRGGPPPKPKGTPDLDTFREAYDKSVRWTSGYHPVRTNLEKPQYFKAFTKVLESEISKFKGILPEAKLKDWTDRLNKAAIKSDTGGLELLAQDVHAEMRNEAYRLMKQLKKEDFDKEAQAIMDKINSKYADLGELPKLEKLEK
jgi:hypothetical protein